MMMILLWSSSEHEKLRVHIVKNERIYTEKGRQSELEASLYESKLVETILFQQTQQPKKKQWFHFRIVFELLIIQKMFFKIVCLLAMREGSIKKILLIEKLCITLRWMFSIILMSRIFIKLFFLATRNVAK